MFQTLHEISKNQKKKKKKKYACEKKESTHAHSKAEVHIEKSERILNCNVNDDYLRAVKLLFLFSSFRLSAFFKCK